MRRPGCDRWVEHKGVCRAFGDLDPGPSPSAGQLQLDVERRVRGCFGDNIGVRPALCDLGRGPEVERREELASECRRRHGVGVGRPQHGGSDVGASMIWARWGIRVIWGLSVERRGHSSEFKMLDVLVCNGTS